MDAEKIKQLMDLAANVYGTGFWKDIFDSNKLNSFTGDSVEKMNDLMGMRNGGSQQTETVNNSNGYQRSPTPTEYKKGNNSFPLVDIIKKERKIIIIIDLPGTRKEDVQLLINQDYLIVKGTTKPKVKDSEGEVILCERHHGSFERHILLPEPTDGSNITAKFLNGVLQVSYPRKEQIGDVIPIE